MQLEKIIQPTPTSLNVIPFHDFIWSSCCLAITPHSLVHAPAPAPLLDDHPISSTLAPHPSPGSKMLTSLPLRENGNTHKRNAIFPPPLLHTHQHLSQKPCLPPLTMDGPSLLEEAASRSTCPLDPTQGYGSNNTPLSLLHHHNFPALLYYSHWHVIATFRGEKNPVQCYFQLYLDKIEKINLKNLL